MKKVFILILLLVGCAKVSTIKSRDIEYRNEYQKELSPNEIDSRWFNCIVAVGEGPLYASGVVIGNSVDGKSTYILTAQHVGIKQNIHILDKGKSYEITSKIHSKNRDITLLIASGIIAEPGKVFKGVPSGDYDVTIGYKGGHTVEKTAIKGRAAPGQSGGGVFSNTNGLFAIVSTVGEAVSIWAALKEMGYDWIL